MNWHLLSPHAVPSGPPLNLTAVFVDSTSLSVVWQPPPETERNGVLLEYQLTYAPNSSLSDITTLIVVGLNASLTQLAIFTVYQVTVRARTSVGTGPPAMETARTDSTGERAMVYISMTLAL